MTPTLDGRDGRGQERSPQNPIEAGSGGLGSSGHQRSVSARPGMRPGTEEGPSYQSLEAWIRGPFQLRED